MVSDGGRNVRECRPTSYAPGCSRAKGHNGDLFAGVVGAAPSGIAAVIRRYDGEIIRLQRLFERRNALVKLFERARLAGGVAAMPVERVEIDEIGKQ